MTQRDLSNIRPHEVRGVPLPAELAAKCRQLVAIVSEPGACEMLGVARATLARCCGQLPIYGHIFQRVSARLAALETTIFAQGGSGK